MIAITLRRCWDWGVWVWPSSLECHLVSKSASASTVDIMSCTLHHGGVSLCHLTWARSLPYGTDSLCILNIVVLHWLRRATHNKHLWSLMWVCSTGCITKTLIVCHTFLLYDCLIYIIFYVNKMILCLDLTIIDHNRLSDGGRERERTVKNGIVCESSSSA